MAHTATEYHAYDTWVWKNAQINFDDIDRLKNDPDAAREEIRMKVMELFHNEQERLESEGVNPSKANSIEAYIEKLEDDVVRSGFPRKGDLAIKEDDIDGWQTHLEVGEQWDERLSKWGSIEEVTTSKEREVASAFPEISEEVLDRELSEVYGRNWADELTKGRLKRDSIVVEKYGDDASKVLNMPSRMPKDTNVDDFIDADIPFVSQTKKAIFVPRSVQEELIESLDPNWRDLTTITRLKTFTTMKKGKRVWTNTGEPADF